MASPSPQVSRRRFVALDVHKRYVVAGAVDRDQQIVLPPRRVSLAELDSWAQSHLEPTDKVVLEATTNAWDLYDRVQPVVNSVKVAHPLLVKLIASARVKTDGRDVLHLARLLAANLVPEVWVPPRPVRELRALVAHRQHLVKRGRALRNRLHSLIHRHNLVPPTGNLFGAELRSWWMSLDLPSSEQIRVRHDLEALDQVEAHKTEATTELARLSMDGLWASQTRLLMQLPGIGIVTTMTLLGAIGDVTRFSSAKKLVGYAGLGASVHASGQTRRTGGITKQGRRDIRKAMIESAWIAVIHHPHWKAQFERLATRIGKRRAIVALARKLLVVVWHVLTYREVAHHADEQAVARKFMTWACNYRLATHLGMPRLAFVRHHLDQLQLGHEMTTMKYGVRTYTLPPSQPVAA